MTKGTHPINQMDLGNSIEQHTAFSLGLTKREYFAAMAMQGMLANRINGYKFLAEESVMMANALIEALNNTDNPNLQP